MKLLIVIILCIVVYLYFYDHREHYLPLHFDDMFRNRRGFDYDQQHLEDQKPLPRLICSGDEKCVSYKIYS